MSQSSASLESSQEPLAIAQILSAQVGNPSLVSANQTDSPWTAAIAKAMNPGAAWDCLVLPQSQAELAATITTAHQQGWQVLPCGQASKLDWGKLSQSVSLVVSTAHLDQIVEHAVGDLTVTVEAGVKFADLQALLAKSQQFLALDPLYPNQATIGGIVATGDTGSLRQRYGSVRDMLLGISFVRADGQLVKAGGRVVKNVAGYDLMKLLTGSYGTLGILTQLTFRVYPLPETSQTMIVQGETAAIAQLSQILRASALTPTALDLIPPPSLAQLNLGAGTGVLVRFQGLQAGVKEQSSRLLELAQALGLSRTVYQSQDEASLWQSLREQIETADSETSILCKIGVLPDRAALVLEQLHSLADETLTGRIYASSGLGHLRFTPQSGKAVLPKMRRLCQDAGGFLSILQAPATLKQQIEVWGYPGNALNLMRQIKQQFDPQAILNPHRFIHGL